MNRMSNCIFCKIIKGSNANQSTGDIPSFKLFETEKTYSFLDIQPTARGHALVIPKECGAKLHNLSDESLADLLPVAKKVAKLLELNVDGPDAPVGYNILQNNGRIAHQEVDHVHFHVIPKTDEASGLGVGWPAQPTDFAELGKLHAELKEKIEKGEF